MSSGFDPYHKLLGIPPEEQPPNYYRLLGLTRKFEDDIEVIENCSNRVMQSLRQHQSGTHGPEIAKLLNEVSTARRTLLNAEKKQAYDAELRAAEAAASADMDQDDEADSPPEMPFSAGADTLSRFRRKPSMYASLAGSGLVLLLGLGVYFAFFRGAPPVDQMAPQAADGDISGTQKSDGAGANQIAQTESGAGTDSITANGTSANSKSANEKSVAANGAGNDSPESASGTDRKTATLRGPGGRLEFRVRKPALIVPKADQGEFSEDLVPLLDPTLDGSPGHWSKDMSGIASKSAETSVLVLPFESLPLGVSLDLTIERLEDGSGEVFVQIPSVGKSATFGIDVSESDAAENGVGASPRTGVYVDSEHLEHAPRIQAVAVFKTRDARKIRLTSTGTSFEIATGAPDLVQSALVTTELETLYKWAGDQRRLSSGPKELPTVLRRVVLVTRGARFKIHSIKYREQELNSLPDPPTQVDGSQLLAAIDPNRDAQRGDWGETRSPLIAPATPNARLQVPVVVPEEYDVSVQVEVAEENSTVVLGLPITRGMLRCELSPKKLEILGLGTTDLESDIFPPGKTVQFDFQVRQRSVRISKDGKLLKQQRLGSKDQLPPDPFQLAWLSPDEQRRIYLGSTGTGYRILGLGMAANSESQLASTIRIDPSSTEFKRPVGTLVGTDEPDQGKPAAPKAKEPELAERAAALETVKAQFKAEFQKARKPDEKMTLAERLRTTADGEAADSATRYVLLEQASLLAGTAGDPKLALEAIDELGNTFACDVLKHKSDALKALVKSTKDAEKTVLLLESAFTLGEQAGAAEKYALAVELYGIASTLSVRAKLRPITEEANELKREMLERQELFTKVEAARKAVDTNGADAEAHLVIGAYLCLKRHDWTAGLQELRQGSVPELKTLAERDLSQPATVIEQGQLARDWLAFAGTDSNHEHAGYADRAVYWFSLAAAGTQGLQQTQYQQSVREAVSARDWDQPYNQLLEKLAKNLEQKRVVKTPVIGNGNTRDLTFDELPSEPGILVGLELRIRSSRITVNGQVRPYEQVDIVRGIYQTASGLKYAFHFGNADTNESVVEESPPDDDDIDTSSRIIRLKARRGYALSGLRIELGNSIHRLAGLFRKITPKGLDADRRYWSDVYGTGSLNGRTTRLIETPDTRTIPIVGLYGTRSNTGQTGRINQIGFITVNP